MKRADKHNTVQDLSGIFSLVPSFVVAHYQGLTVNELRLLRGQLREHGGSVKVLKNSLAKRAVQGTAHEVCGTLFSGPCAVGYSVDDPTVAPRVFKKFSRDYSNLSIIGGSLEGVLLSASQVNDLADLPSLDVLRQKLLGLVMTPAQRLVGILGQPGASIARALNARVEAGIGE